MDETDKSNESPGQEVQEPDDPTSAQETPAEGSVLLPGGDTPPKVARRPPRRCRDVRPEGAATYQPRAERSAALGNGCLGEHSPERAELVADVGRLLRPFRAWCL